MTVIPFPWRRELSSAAPPTIATDALAEPWADLGQTKKQFTAFLLDLTEKRIAEAERMLPCSACLACQWTTCRKAGAYRNRRLILHQHEATR